MKKQIPKKLILILVTAIVGLIILFTPQCSVDRQALSFDIERYMESPDTEICDMLVQRIQAYNQQCNGDMVAPICG